MIKLLKLTAENFKLYQNTEINFDGKSGIVSLLGRNADGANFDSNGAGKTTLISAITHCLYGKNLNGDSIETLANAYTGLKPCVTLEFQVDNDKILVIRDDNKKVLQLYVNGELQKYARKSDTNSAIENLLGMSYNTFSKLIYLSPNQSSLFSVSDSTAQGKFIQELLDIDFVEGINKQATLALKEYSGLIKIAQQQVSMYQNHIDNLSLQLNTVPSIDDKDYSSSLNTFKAEFAELSRENASLEKALTKLNTEIDSIKTRRMEMQATYNVKDGQRREQENLIASEVCPTCRQPTKDLVININKTTLEGLSTDIKEVTKEELDKRNEITRMETKIGKVKAKGLELKEKIKEIETKQKAQAEGVGHKMLRDTLNEQLAEATRNLVTAQRELSQYEDYVYIYDLIKQCSSAGGFIKERVSLFIKLYNRVLREFGVKLLGEEFDVRVVKDEKNNFALKLDDGEVDLLYSSLSSGTKARLDVLSMVALNKVVEILTGQELNLVVLDEIMAVIDKNGIDQIEQLFVEIKKNFPEKLMLVVLHGASLSQTDGILEAVRANNKTQLIWK